MLGVPAGQRIPAVARDTEGVVPVRVRQRPWDSGTGRYEYRQCVTAKNEQQPVKAAGDGRTRPPAGHSGDDFGLPDLAATSTPRPKSLPVTRRCPGRGLLSWFGVAGGQTRVTPGRSSCWTSRRRRPAAIPTPTSSSTTSPSAAGTQGSARTAANSVVDVGSLRTAPPSTGSRWTPAAAASGDEVQMEVPSGLPHRSQSLVVPAARDRTG